jgi:serine/threonine-protein kinase
VLRDQQKLDDALAKYEQAVTIKRKLFGQAHPTVALTYSNMGDIYYAQGRYDLADEALQDAIAAWETAVGPDHPDLAIGLSTLGRVRVAQHRPLEAIELLERASKLRGEHAPHREQWEQKLGLAQALHEAGRERERALRLAREASSHLAQSPGSTEADHAKVRAVLLELRAEVDEGTATPEDSPPETSPAP